MSVFPYQILGGVFTLFFEYLPMVDLATVQADLEFTARTPYRNGRYLIAVNSLCITVSVTAP